MIKVGWKHKKAANEVQPLLEAAAAVDPLLPHVFPRPIEAIICATFPVAFESHPKLHLRTIVAVLREIYGLHCPSLLRNGDEPLAGYLFARGDHAVIFSDPQYGDAFERFTRAHEAAHLVVEYLPLLHRSRQPLLFGGSGHEPEFFARRDPVEHIFLAGRPVAPDTVKPQHASKSWLREVIANACAAELLAPYQHVAALLARANGTDDPVELLRTRFDISRRAAEVRLMDLGVLEPGEPILWLTNP